MTLTGLRAVQNIVAGVVLMERRLLFKIAQFPIGVGPLAAFFPLLFKGREVDLVGLRMRGQRGSYHPYMEKNEQCRVRDFSDLFLHLYDSNLNLSSQFYVYKI